MKILLVEDNLSIIQGLEYSFVKEKMVLISKKSIKDALNYLEQNTPNLIIIDITLPDGNGLNLFENNSKIKNIPCLFLTAIDEEDIIVKALNLGAEDYITKPFSTKELLARVNKILLRNTKKTVIEIANIKFDLDKMIIYKDNMPVEVSSLELKILHYLFLNLNKVVRRGALLDKLWEWTGNDVDDHTLTVYINRIREKLNTDIIVTIKGIGYRIDEK